MLKMNICASDLFCTERSVAKGLEKLLLFRCFKDRDNTPGSKLQIPVWIEKTRFKSPYPHMANNQLLENNLSVRKKHLFSPSQKHENLCILNMPVKFVATSCYKFWDWVCIEILSNVFLLLLLLPLVYSFLWVDNVEVK